MTKHQLIFLSMLQLIKFKYFNNFITKYCVQQDNIIICQSYYCIAMSNQFLVKSSSEPIQTIQISDIENIGDIFDNIDLTLNNSYVFTSKLPIDPLINNKTFDITINVTQYNIIVELNNDLQFLIANTNDITAKTQLKDAFSYYLSAFGKNKTNNINKNVFVPNVTFAELIELLNLNTHTESIFFNKSNNNENSFKNNILNKIDSKQFVSECDLILKQFIEKNKSISFRTIYSKSIITIHERIGNTGSHSVFMSFDIVQPHDLQLILSNIIYYDLEQFVYKSHHDKLSMNNLIYLSELSHCDIVDLCNLLEKRLTTQFDHCLNDCYVYLKTHIAIGNYINSIEFVTLINHLIKNGIVKRNRQNDIRVVQYIENLILQKSNLCQINKNETNAKKVVAKFVSNILNSL